MPNAKHPRLKRKRNDSEKAMEAVEAGLKSGQDVAALVIAKADPKPHKKP